tara:strand:- start:5638 stop:7014 length:1377 start_codon:yes stop_codon:yes gene_type:complete
MSFVKNSLFNSFPVEKVVPLLPKAGLVFGSVLMGQWFLGDIAHIPGGALGVALTAGGIWWFFQSDKPKFNSPKTVKGWISRCYEVIEQFELIEDQEKFIKNKKTRINALDEILNRSTTQRIAFTSTKDVEFPPKENTSSSLDIKAPLNISYQGNLPIRNEEWNLPDNLQIQDAVIYVLPLPLRAVDLLWLKTFPKDQPSWILVSWKENSSWSEQFQDLKAQLPERWSSRVLRWTGSSDDFKSVLNPVRRLLEQPKSNIEVTKQRLLSRLHSDLQFDLEELRREKFKLIQNRSQWIVAGAVFTSPIPSGDLLSVAVLNGLMIQEMANIWSCKMNPELLQVVARKLACAAIAQGIVEWSGQALLGVAKLHGGSWLAAGSMQALSAAYLTRVVGRSMADWMALNNGVSELDIKLLEKQASQLVTEAAEKERVDWLAFLKQGKNWIEHQVKETTLNNQILGI